MGYKIGGGFLFVPEDFGRLINVGFTTIIAAHVKSLVDRRSSADGIGQSERYTVGMEQVLPQVEPTVLAKYNPAVVIVFPHQSFPDTFGGWVGPVFRAILVNSSALVNHQISLCKNLHLPLRQISSFGTDFRRSS